MNLSEMSKDELLKLRKDVEKAITSFEDRQRNEALAKLEAAAREMGFSSLAELTGTKPMKGGVPKYRDPSDPSKTWTGRGRQPNWVKDALAAGQDLEDLKIA